MAPDADDSGFLSRWSRRKALVRQGVPLQEPAAPALPTQAMEPAVTPLDTTEAQTVVIAPADAPGAQVLPTASAEPLPQEAPPTLADAALLTRNSDYTRFVARGVQPEVKNAALAKLFTDPHFNVMDGLDTYIDDYGKADPLPPGMLRKMLQAHSLGLFDHEKIEPANESTTEPVTDPAAALAAPAEAPPPPPEPASDEDTDLQLQPDDGAGRAGPEAGAGEDAGQPH